jgi:murein DD-endopeptidase MepM/ murein hydrolase activator NlpD
MKNSLHFPQLLVACMLLLASINLTACDLPRVLTILNQALTSEEQITPQSATSMVDISMDDLTPTAPRLVQGTPAPDSNSPLPPEEEIQPVNVSTSEADPLHFIFPTPRPAPISAWRPPLYSAPWALTPYDHFYFTRPIAADRINWPLADYRYGALFPGTEIIHTGIDIDAPTGTAVLAAAPGKVVWSGYGLLKFTKDVLDPYGLAVAIEHDFGHQGNRLYTVYAHMKDIFVINNQRVETGTVLGLVGSTGNTTGPHLHFEVRYGENSYYATRNPELWLAPPQGWGVLTGRVMKIDGSLLRQKEIVIRSIDKNQVWYAATYSPLTVKSDPYYRENMVLSDLPAGKYTVEISYENQIISQEVDIQPGMVTHFTYYEGNPISVGRPPTPSPDSFLSPQANP